MNIGTVSADCTHSNGARRPGLSEYCTRLRLLSGGIGMTLNDLGALARAGGMPPSSLLLSELGVD